MLCRSSWGGVCVDEVMNYGEWHRDGDLGQGAPLMPGAEDLDAPGDEHLFLDETKYGRNTYR